MPVTLANNKLLIVLFLMLFSSASVCSQYQITGFTPVLPGINYGPYTISGGAWATGDHWCVTGGTINGTTNTCMNNTGTPSIGVTWNTGITSGTVAYYLSGAGSPVVTYNVCIVNNALNSTTINAQFAPDYYPFVPLGKLQTLNLLATDASNCGPITYWWEISNDGTNYTPIPNTNTQNYSINQAFTQNTFYRRAVSLNPYVNYTSSISVTPVAQPQAGSISPAYVPLNAGSNAGTFTATAATGGTMCGGNYTYTWQTSADNLNWTNAGSGLSFSPGIISVRTYIRQLAFCGPIAGISNTAVVDPYQPLIGGLISPGFISVPPGTNIGTLTGSPASYGNASAGYVYQWMSTTDIDNIPFSPISGASGPAASNYTPPAPGSTIYYERMVTCNGQTAYSNTITIKIGALSTSNYIKSRSITASNITSSASADALTALVDVKQTTQYLDGLGRLNQTVMMKGSLITSSTPTPTDIVSVSQYDAVGREVFKYLPYVSTTTDGSYKSNSFPEQNAYNNVRYPNEIYNYQQVNYEISLLDRINSTRAAGVNWTGSNRGNQVMYASNSTIDLVRMWYVAPNGIPGNFSTYNTPGFYPAGALFKQISTDESNKQLIEFKDKNGNVILKKNQLSAIADDGTGSSYDGWLCTYYIYDDWNNLRCVIQPHGVELLIQNGWNTAALSGVIANEQCFLYEYDQRNRIIVKKVPGADPVYIVYDNLDRIAMTQDGNLRVLGKWNVTLYENNLDRPVQTGLYSTSTSFANLLSAAASSSSYPFSVASEPSYPTWELLTVTHYDNYTGLPAGISNVLNIGAISISNFYTGTACNVSPSYALPLAQNSNNTTMGLTTWTQTEVLGSAGLQYISASIIYDDRAKMIQQQILNYSGGIDISTLQYDFTGKALITDLRHQKLSPGNPTQTYELVTRNSYDDLGRAIKTEKMIIAAVIPTSAWKIIATMSYDALGLLTTKTIGNNPTNTGSSYIYLESLAYEYNIRGWLLGINRSYLNTTGLTNYFGYELGYDKLNTVIPATTYSTAQFNGNISGTVWKNGSDLAVRKYDFSYDAVNRLTNADFKTYNGTFNRNDGLDFSAAVPLYDANGNILQMTQMGWKASGSVFIDNLTYNLVANTNRLQNVIDGASDQNTSLSDFRYSPAYTSSLGGTGKTASTSDYDYDNNGNLKSDKNKDITSISYNYLNLPVTITFSGNGTVSYIYDAAGNKLAKTVLDNNVNTMVNGTQTTATTINTYIAGFVYETKQYGALALSNLQYTDKLQLFGHEEGRIRGLYKNFSSPNTLTGFVFDYFLKDHLGNTRMVLTEDQQTDVYPTLDFEGSSATDGNVINENAAWDKASGNSIDILNNRITALPTGFNAGTNGSACGSITKAQGAIGAAKLIKIMARDQLNVSINYTYSTSSINNTSAGGLNTLLNSLAAMILGSSEVGDALHAQSAALAAAQNNTIVTGLFNSNGENPSGVTTDPPKAFLHVLLFNDQFVFDNQNSVVVPITAAGLNAEGTIPPQIITVAKSGYAYVYFSNESNTTVYFDNFLLTHVRAPILDASSYYPFGLTMAGISGKAISFGTPENRYKFNKGSEIQNKEFTNGGGLELYDASFRLYDPQIGRFMQQDPVEGVSLNSSVYAFANNNPLLLNDPFGLLSTQENPEILKTVYVYGKKKPKPTGGFPWPEYTKKEAQEFVQIRGDFFAERKTNPHPSNPKYKPYYNSLELQWIANRDWKRNSIGAVLLIGSPALLASSPLACNLVFGTKNAWLARVAITGGDMALQYLEKGKINWIQAGTSSLGALSYAVAGSGDLSKEGYFDENATITTVAVSTVFNVIGGKSADYLQVANAPVPVIGLFTTITSLWGDNVNSLINNTPFIQWKP
ncbi:MAG: DUF6443 domain-containing protein [Bacteroidota bacterium]